MLDPDKWFTEICEEGGSALSLELRKKLHSETTPFQTIDIYETTAFGNLMVIDGFVMLTARDNFFYHEMMSHPALFSHNDPKRIVIIGGGDCGTLREVLRHDSVNHVLQVEIDERVTRLSEQFFPELCELNEDPRADFLFGDGIEWMTDANDDSVDIIIVDSTDPIGPAVGLFNTPFYTQCHRVLTASGIMVQQSESPLIHQDILASMRKNMHTAGFDQVHTLCFPQPTYPTGYWSATMARKGAAGLQAFREDAARSRPFETRYYNADTHRAALAVPEFMK